MTAIFGVCALALCGLLLSGFGCGSKSVVESPSIGIPPDKIEQAMMNIAPVASAQVLMPAPVSASPPPVFSIPVVSASPPPVMVMPMVPQPAPPMPAPPMPAPDSIVKDMGTNVGDIRPVSMANEGDISARGMGYSNDLGLHHAGYASDAAVYGSMAGRTASYAEGMVDPSFFSGKMSTMPEQYMNGGGYGGQSGYVGGGGYGGQGGYVDGQSGYAVASVQR